MKYNKQLYLIKTQIYQYIYGYIMHKHINTNTDIVQVQWKKYPWKVNIYNKLSNVKQNWGVHSVKCINVSHRTQI